MNIVDSVLKRVPEGIDNLLLEEDVRFQRANGEGDAHGRRVGEAATR